MHLKRNVFKLKPNRLIDWKKVSILSCCCLILLLLGEFGLNTQYLLLEVNWLGFCNSVFVLFSILFISASACSCVLWHGGFYILCLLFVIVCLLVCVVVLNMETKTKTLKYLLVYVFVNCVFVCGKRKNASLTNERSNWIGKLQMLNTTSSLVCVCVYSELYTLLLFCFRPMLLCVCVIQRLYICVDFMYSLFVLAYIYILWSLCVFVSIRRRIFPDYFNCVCFLYVFK